MKQKLIKTAVLFFALMAVFTILSRVAYNLSTPKVILGQTESMEMGPEITGSGIVEARKEIPVIVAAEQLIRSVNVIAGQEIKEGEVLFELEREQLERNIRIKEQELKSIELQIQSAKKAQYAADQAKNLMISQAETDYQRAVDLGNENVLKAEKNLDDVRKEYQRFKENPSEYPGYSEEEFAQKIKEMQSEYDMAVRTREENVYQAKKSVELANISETEEYSLEQMEVERQQKEEVVEQLKVLKETEGKILSPTNGVISEVNIKPGSMTSGMGDILIFSATEGLVLKAQFPQEQKEYLVRGAKVNVSSEMFTEGELNKLGELQINTVGNSAEGMGIEVMVFLENDFIPIGTSLNMRIKTEKKTYADCLPLSALHQAEEGKYYVYVLDEQKSILGDEKIARKVNVEIEYKGELYVAVTGLSREQEIILSSTKELKDGGRVKPQEP